MDEKMDLIHLNAETNERIEETASFSENYLNLRKKFMVQRSPRFNETGPKNIAEESQAENQLLKDKQSFTEKHLRAIWFDGKFEHRGLRLVDGRKVSVISSGIWNSHEGPDFQEAEIRIGDEVLHGDVELHLSSSDWGRHGHQKDSKYNQVVLHVTLFHNARQEFVLNSKGDKIPQLELKNSLTDNLEHFYQTFDVNGYPYKSNALLGECGKKIGLPSRIHPERYDFIQSLFLAAGDGRILLKGAPFQKPFADGNFSKIDALLYERMMEGLGYSENKLAMRELAERVPYAALKKLAAKSSGEIRTRRIQSLLLFTAGLLPGASDSLDEEAKKFYLTFQSELEHIDLPSETMKKAQWKFRGLRPHNYPARRLSGFSYFLAQVPEKGFFRPALEMVQNWENSQNGDNENQSFSRKLAEVKKFLFQPGWGYFGLHASPGGKKFSKRVALIGEERALTIWVNTFLPALIQWCKQNKEEKLETELYRFWMRLPMLSENSVSKMMLLRFLGARGATFPIQKEQIQQGLLQLFQDFCDTKPTACIGCPFPRLASLSIPELSR